ncbi:NADH-quinone oxidoreductase subunit J family protein [Symmachiella dynata]|uniref:NADH-quinone oxidoreductase subunit J n=1 Tax=Symmachiella dynata TaxID=2527995 RepID=A0A517ZTX5_9PLAN|nr:NADH-quinone oxidoreductase subunit J [Symmachiella dynata]QDT50167.1 NADH-quinone oxidoreductase subunit J [Symmachiella dynata]QDU45894.1 NADH-quinone oxidoreductase subunit J [Symmachiella dynata]
MFQEFLFWVFGIAVCGGALGVVLSQNIVRMAFWLIISLGSTSGLFFLLQADFVGAVQLMVYVGGTLVLLIFGIMLTASGPYVTMKTSPTEWVVAAIVSSALLGLITVSAFGVDWHAVDGVVSGHSTENRPEGYTTAQQGRTIRPLGFALLGVRPDKDLNQPGEPTGVGYLLPFEIVSVHLLVVLVGAAYLARAKRRVDPLAKTTAS